MNSSTTRRFREMLASLPDHVRKQARKAYRLFEHDSTHPSLHFKQIHSDPRIYSARIGIGYRAVGLLDGDAVVWYWVGSHAEYDQLLKQL